MRHAYIVGRFQGNAAVSNAAAPTEPSVAPPPVLEQVVDVSAVGRAVLQATSVKSWLEYNLVYLSGNAGQP